MAADFWASSQFQRLISKSSVKDIHAEERARGLSSEQIKQIKNHFYSLIVDLARHAKLRQRVAAAAMTYFRRFYVRSSFFSHDPRLMAPGCVYVSSKCEESIIQARHLVAYMKKLRPNWSYDVQHLLEAEMILLEGLDYNLVVYNPYRPLSEYVMLPELADLAKPAWAVLNDSYRTDVCLFYPPYVIAIGCLFFAATTKQKDIGSWLETLQVDLNHVYDVSMELVAMYEKHSSLISLEECNQLLPPPPVVPLDRGKSS